MRFNFKNLHGLVKKWDIIIIIVLFLLSLTPTIIFSLKYNKKYDSVYAEITVAGQLYKTVNLSNNIKEEFVVQTKFGWNKVVVDKNKIGIYDADCPDKVCMNPQFVSKPGESLVCLPNRLMIYIKGSGEDDIIYAY